MLESERAGVRRWTAALASVLLASGSVAACAHGASGPGSSNGIGGDGGGPGIAGAGGHPSSGPSMSGPSTDRRLAGRRGRRRRDDELDGQWPVRGDPCKLAAPQCGCPGGKECNLDSNDMVSCVAAGTATDGEACSEPDRLRARAHLPHGVGVGERVRQVLRERRRLHRRHLLGVAEQREGNIPNVTLCSTTCDPITNSGCTIGGSGCLIGQETSGAMRWFSSCYPAGTGVQGTPCTTSATCGPRLWCITSSDSGEICAGFCNVNAPSCPGGTSCSAVADQNMQPIVVDGVTYGACLPP